MLEAPDAVITLSTGEDVRLSSLWAEQPLVLSFLRHAGCIFCREHVGEMKRVNTDLNVLFVSLDEPEDVQMLKEEMDSPHLFASDPNRVVYERYQVAQGTLGQTLSLGMIGKGARAMMKGYRQKRPTADVYQLAGTFVISTEGKITWLYEAKTAADNPSPEEVRSALLAASGGKEDE